ncbi:unnamed protein product [Alopecurus aequalis]
MYWLRKNVHTLRQISRCTVHNGTSTFFWLDRWILPEPLATAFPALYSHHLKQHALVSDLLQIGIETDLRNRLTPAASSELRLLDLLLQDVSLSPNADDRALLDGTRFTARGAYAALSTQMHDSELDTIWTSFTPQKVKIFGWLLHFDKLNTRANLLKKHILESATCPRCSHPVEDRQHPFFSCPLALAVWARIGINPSTNQFSDLWATPTPHGLPLEPWPSVALTILLKIWDARNAMVFRSVSQDTNTTLCNIVNDLRLWIHRCKTPLDKERADLWCSFLSTRRT